MSKYLIRKQHRYLDILALLMENSLRHNTLMLSNDECMILYSIVKDLVFIDKIKHKDQFYSGCYEFSNDLPDTTINESYVRHLYNSSILKTNNEFLGTLEGFQDFIIKNADWWYPILNPRDRDLNHVKNIVDNLKYRIDNEIYKYGHEINYKTYCESIKREENINKILRDGR